ncbi:hypothetical protein LC55x_3622 [Lysobacter capsici]|nr:hypothetical protein LC55x_3622 [Lysobacter capsici]
MRQQCEIEPFSRVFTTASAVIVCAISWIQYLLAMHKKATLKLDELCS